MATTELSARTAAERGAWLRALGSTAARISPEFSHDDEKSGEGSDAGGAKARGAEGGASGEKAARRRAQSPGRAVRSWIADKVRAHRGVG